MQLIFKRNPNNKLYSETFLEIRQSSVQTRAGANVDIILNSTIFNTGIIRTITTKVVRDLTDDECWMAFSMNKFDASKLLGNIYRTMYPELMNVDVMTIQQDATRLQTKLQSQQSSLFS
jgi:hypothetical protein